MYKHAHTHTAQQQYKTVEAKTVFFFFSFYFIAQNEYAAEEGSEKPVAAVPVDASSLGRRRRPWPCRTDVVVDGRVSTFVRFGHAVRCYVSPS